MTDSAMSWTATAPCTTLTQMIGSHGELEVILGELNLGVLGRHGDAGVVDEDMQLAVGGVEVIDELLDRLGRRQVQLHNRNDIDDVTFS